MGLGDDRLSEGSPIPAGSQYRGGRVSAATTLTNEIRHLLGQKPRGKEGMTWLQVMAKVAVIKASQGDFRFYKEIYDRTEGKVPDRIAGADGGPIGFEAILQGIEKIYGGEEAREVEVRLLGPSEPPQLESQGQDTE